MLSYLDRRVIQFPIDLSRWRNQKKDQINADTLYMWVRYHMILDTEIILKDKMAKLKGIKEKDDTFEPQYNKFEASLQ